jgi:hypothetical protein
MIREAHMAAITGATTVVVAAVAVVGAGHGADPDTDNQY